MRTKVIIKNGIYSTISFLILIILGLIDRKVFLHILNIEYLGYEGLFSNIFSLLSLAEMGVGSVITYNLYYEIARQNKNEITKLMMIYKNIYRFIGIFVTVIGILIIPFLKFLIIDNQISFAYIIMIYLVLLISTICTYFLAYRRILFIANQMEFECIKVDTIVNIIIQIVKILVLIWSQNYIFYLSINIIKNILSNLIISRKYKKTFSFALKVHISFEDFKSRNFFKDIKNFMIHKISYLVYGGISNIVITTILGINTVGFFSNYMLIKTHVWTVINKMLNPMQATIGNLVYSEDSSEKGEKIFFMLEMGSFFLASFISITLFIFFQPFMEVWLGKQYLQSLFFVFLLAHNIYIGTIHEILYYFRTAFGVYELDRKYMLYAAIVNLILSIGLTKKMGLSGIMIGSNIGLMFIWYGRLKVVFNKYIKQSVKIYIYKHIVWMLLAFCEGVVVYIITRNIANNLSGLCFKLVVCIIIPNSINLIIFYRTNAFKMIRQYAKQVFNIVRSKLSL